MGLALFAIRDMTPSMTMEDWKRQHPGQEYENNLDGTFCEQTSSYEWQENVFPGRLGGLEIDMIYSYSSSDTRDFSMGAYSTYNAFRRTLESFDWQDGRGDLEFEDVCEFSDCDGVIGPETSQELYYAFNRNRDDYIEFLSEKLELSPQEVENHTFYYDNMKEAFEFAGGTGVVIFC